ncbi:MAG: membrane protein insertase YidC [Candidatus Hatepunaea meridiana]|nr:membrane protein insertase YidC [Candidatus Hatepunaea meridiana]
MNRNTIIALVIIGIIFIFYDDYIKWLYPLPPESEVDSTLVKSEEYQKEQFQQAPSEQLHLKAAPEDSSIAAEEKLTFQEIAGIETLPEQFITIETEQLKVKLSTRGARIVSFQLKPNGRYLKHDLELLPASNLPRPGFRFWTYEGPVETNSLSFQLDDRDYEGDQFLKLTSGQKQTIRFTASLGSDRSLTVIYQFKGDGYDFDYDVESSGLETTWVRDYAEVYWKGGLNYTDRDTSQELYYSKAYIYFKGDELEDQKINGKKTEIIGPLSGEVRWCALRTKYFMAALIPETISDEGAWMESLFDSTHTGKKHPNRLGVGLKIPLKNGNPVTPIKVYIGPIDDDILIKVDPSLKHIMNWGWAVIAPFSKMILWSLKKLSHIIPNYGLCIIIFSILIKILVYPLTRKSYQSMSAMQGLQPKIKALREKYKDDQQRVNKEMMKLYKTEKVNPMGGCLPMLIQMPLLYGLFIVFRSTIEFRNAPFIFWITDLSQPDILFHLPFLLPLYGSHVALLPILMGISTFFQSKSTITDPNQKMMLYFMPIFMTLIFNQFPSGLTLYYTLFNVLTIVQQKITPPPKLATKSK